MTIHALFQARRPSPRVEKCLLGSVLIAVFFLPIGKGISEFFLVLSLIGYLFQYRLSQFKNLNWAEKCMILFFGWICITLPFAAEKSYWVLEFRGVLKWGETFLVYWIVSQIFQGSENRTLFTKIFVLSTLLIAASGFYQLFNGTDFLRGQTLDPGRIIRIKSSLGSPNSLSCFFYFGIFSAILLTFKAQSFKIHKTLYTLIGLLSLAVFIAGFILTYSRGAFAGLILASCFFLLTQLHILRNRKFLVALAIFFVIFLSSAPLRQNFVQSLQKKDITISLRTEYWSISSKMISQSPFLGIGTNLFHREFNRFRTSETVPAGYAHNSYLQIASENGIPGLLLFLSIFLFLAWSHFQQIIRNKKTSSPVQADSNILFIPLFTFLIHAAVDNLFFAYQTAFLFWIFLGLSEASQADQRVLR